MITLMLLLVVAGFGTTIASAMGRCPLWVPVLLLWVLAGLEYLPR
jgi:hypothetical protein